MEDNKKVDLSYALILARQINDKVIEVIPSKETLVQTISQLYQHINDLKREKNKLLIEIMDLEHDIRDISGINNYMVI